MDAILEYAQTLDEQDISDLPLYSIPFAVKDNMDVAGVSTTAACHEYSYCPAKKRSIS